MCMRARTSSRAYLYVCMCRWMESCIFNVCSYKFISLPLFLSLSRSVYTSSFFSRHFCASGFLSVKQYMVQQRACLIISINFTDMPRGSTKTYRGNRRIAFIRARARSYSSDRTLLSAPHSVRDIFKCLVCQAFILFALAPLIVSLF